MEKSAKLSSETGSFVPSHLSKYGEKTPENCTRLQNRLDTLVDGSRVFPTAAALVDAIAAYHEIAYPHLTAKARKDVMSGITSDKITRFKGGDHKHFGNPAFSLIVQFLLAQGLYFERNRGTEIANSFEDPMFHAMLNFMGIGDITLGKLRYRAPGLYRSFRPSSTYPSLYWRGLLEITHDQRSGVMRSKESYHARPRDGRPSFEINFTGYLFRKSQQHFIISRDEEESSISVTLINNFSLDRGRLLTLRGAVLDMSRGRPYSSRVFYERAEEAAVAYDETRQTLVDNRDVITADEMPPSILNFFLEREIPHVKMY